MSRRIFTLILTIVICTSIVLSGCGAAVNSNEGTTAVNETTGATVNEFSFPYTGDPVEISYLGPDFRTADNTFDKRLDKELAEKFGNVTIKNNYVPEGDIATKLNLLLNSADISDITAVKDQTPQAIANTYGETGSLLDYSKYMEYMPNYAADGELYPLTYGKTEDGQILAMDTNIGYYNFFGWSAQINKYYENKYGIKDPTTAAEMLDALRQVKKVNPNCTSPLTVFPGGRMLVVLNQMFLGQGEGVASENSATAAFDWQDTKKWYYPVYTPQFKAEIEFAHTLYAEGLVAKDYATQSWDKFVKNLYSSGDGWYIFADWIMFGEIELEQGKAIKPEFGIDFLLTPTTEYQKSPIVFPTNTKGANSGYAVVTNSNTKNPELVCSLIDYLHSEEISMLIGWGWEGETYKKIDANSGPAGMSAEILPAVKAGTYYKTGTIDPKELGLIYDYYRHQFTAVAGGWHNESYLGQLANAWNGPNVLAWNKKTYDYGNNNPDKVVPLEPLPVLTLDESEKVNKIYTSANTIIAKNIVLFINGKRPMSEWDNFIAEIKASGDPQQVVDIYNSKPRVKVFAE